MVDFSDALGLAALPGPAELAPPGTTVSLGDLSTGGSIDVPLRPPATAVASPPTPARSSMASASGGIDLNQILGLLRQPQQPSGFMPNFMASLGAGLSSAGQNWNKPAMAAFASGAGAAIQGGQALQQHQQKDRLALVNLALHAWQIGDMATYHQALIKLRAARVASPAAPPAAPAALDAASAPPEGTAPPMSPASPARTTSLSAAPPVALVRTAPPDALAQARDAIARGAPREAVMARLREHGIDPISV
jgi:hypothetical protein